MEDIKPYTILCRVCLRGADPGNQLIMLEKSQIEKLVYIGDGSEVCLQLKIKLLKQLTL